MNEETNDGEAAATPASLPLTKAERLSALNEKWGADIPSDPLIDGPSPDDGDDPFGADEGPGDSELAADGDPSAGEAAADEGAPDASGSEPEADAEPAEQPSRQERVSKSLARIARREASLRQRERDLQQQADESRAMRDAVALLRTDPLRALEQLRIDPNDFNRAASLSTESETDRLHREVQQLKRERALDQQREADARAVESYRLDTKRVVETNADRFPLLSAAGEAGIADVLQTVGSYYKQYGRQMTPAQAAAHVETFLRMEAADAAPAKPAAKKVAPPQGAKTISNKLPNGSAGNNAGLKGVYNREERLRKLGIG